MYHDPFHTANVYVLDFILVVMVELCVYRCSDCNRITHICIIYTEIYVFVFCVAGLFVAKVAITTVLLLYVLRQHNRLIEVNVLKALAEE